MAHAVLPQQRRFGETSRTDAWWTQSLLVFLGFSAFIVYSTWAAFHPGTSDHPSYWFHANGADYYQRTGRLITVNGDLPMDDVTEQIFRILEDHHA